MKHKGEDCYLITRSELIAALRRPGAYLRTWKFGPYLYDDQGRELHPRTDTVGRLIEQGVLVESPEANKVQRNSGMSTWRLKEVVTALVLVALLCVSASAQIKEKPGFGEKKAKTLDWSFPKDWRFSVGLGFSGTGLLADQQSSRSAERRGAIELNPNVRDANGHLNRSKQTLFWAVSNAALLPADLSPNHKWRWVSFGGRVFLGCWFFSRASHNFALKGGR